MQAGAIMSFVLICLLGLVAIVWLSIRWFEAEAESIGERHAMEAVYPDLERVQIAGRAKLNRYAVQMDGSYLVPVERAMELVAAEHPANADVSSEMLP